MDGSVEIVTWPQRQKRGGVSASMPALCRTGGLNCRLSSTAGRARARVGQLTDWDDDSGMCGQATAKPWGFLTHGAAPVRGAAAAPGAAVGHGSAAESGVVQAIHPLASGLAAAWQVRAVGRCRGTRRGAPGADRRSGLCWRVSGLPWQPGLVRVELPVRRVMPSPETLRPGPAFSTAALPPRGARATRSWPATRTPSW